MTLPKEFNICIIKPENFEYSRIFFDQALYYRYQFSKFGYTTTIYYNELRRDVTNFVFGAWLGFDPSLKKTYPCIFINLEQLGPNGSNQFSQDYIDLLKSSPAIDYDPANVKFYATPNTVPIAPILYAPYLTNLDPIPLEDRPIDILFFGFLSNRRLAVIERLQAAGLTVEYIKRPTFGAELENLIKRSKCVLNIHAYESSVFEQARASMCLSLGTPVVSERNASTNPHHDYENSVFWCDNSKFEEFFITLFATTEFYKQAKENIRNFIYSNDTEDYLRIVKLGNEFFNLHYEINPVSFTSNKLKVIIYAPPFDEASGGSVALYRLAILLKEKDIDVSIWNWLRIHPNESRFLNGKNSTNFNAAVRGDATLKNSLSQDLKEANIDEISSSIVIYPELIEGNPLGATKIVRWLLNKPGLVSNNISYSMDDKFIFWQDSYLDVNQKLNLIGRLSLSLIFASRYYNKNKLDRNGSCYLIRKGYNRTHNMHPHGSVCIDDKDHDDICDIFNNSKFLYSYDDNTAYLQFAILSGCIPIIIPTVGLSFNDLKPNEVDQYGIAYGTENIDWAIKTAPLAIEAYKQYTMNESIGIDHLARQLKLL